MRAAEGKLQAQAPTDALQPENRALAELQRAEEEYEKQVSQQRGGGGGGGGGAGSVQEDLAELFKQDLDKLANQDRNSAKRAAAAIGSASRRADGRCASWPADSSRKRSASGSRRSPGRAARAAARASARSPNKPKRRRDSSSACRASAIVRISRRPRRPRGRPPTPCGARRRPEIRAVPGKPARRSVSCARRSAGSSRSRAPVASATCNRHSNRPKKSRASTASCHRRRCR